MGVDVITRLLLEMRSNGALFDRDVLTGPWSVRFEDTSGLTLVTLLHGSGWVHVGAEPPVPIAAKDFVVLVGAEDVVVSDQELCGGDPTVMVTGVHECRDHRGIDVADDVRLGSHVLDEPGAGTAAMLTGRYQVRGRLSDRLLSALPTVLVVPGDGRPCPILDLTVDELRHAGPGSQAILDRLLDVLMLTALRDWLELNESPAPAWYQALADPVVGPPMKAMHDQPAAAWTVEQMARIAGVSRATFSRRFSELVGETPMAYLNGWRLAVAADLLARGGSTVDAVAREVGYANGYALSVAFKRVYGLRPSDYRRADVLVG